MKYKVGDRVKIKSWEQMEKEYGLNCDGNIDCECVFTLRMKKHCGTVKTIAFVGNVESYYYMKDCDALCDCAFSDDMIECLVTDDSEERKSDNHDPVNHPSHYCREGGMESIEEMVAVFGKEAVMHFCLCNIWKYRYRANDKNGDEDLKKSDWYMKKYIELKEVEKCPMCKEKLDWSGE